MSPWTYLTGAVVSGSFLALLTGAPLSWIGWAGAVAGALAPDILSRNRSRFFAHSLLAAAGTTLFWWSLSWEQLHWPLWFSAGWGAGYLVHLLLDSMTIPGASLFWPSSLIAVLPKPEQFRIEPGTPGERRLRTVLLITGIFLVPLQAVGLRGALHRLVQTPQAAEEDYLRHTHDNHRVWIEFQGFFNSSQRPVSGKWEAIHAPTANTLLVLDPSGKVHRIGNHPADTIRPSRVRALRGEPIHAQARELSLKHQPLKALLSDLPKGGQVYLTGWAVLEESIALNYSQEEFPTITITDRRLEFNHTPVSELDRHRLAGIPVLRGYFLIRIVRSRADAGA